MTRVALVLPAHDGAARPSDHPPMRFLLATDGSPGADDALELLAALPVPATDEVIVLAVADVPLFGPTAEESLVVATYASARDRAAETADDAARRLRERGFAVRALSVEGSAAATIERVAIEEGADLVVVGSRGLGALTGRLFGSVARSLARRASVPVLVVRGAPLAPRRILAAIDGSASATAAIAVLRRLPLPADATVTLLHVLREPPDPPRIRDDELRDEVIVAIARTEREHASHVLAEAAGRLRALKVGDSVVERGRASERILARAAAEQSGLIVLGSHQKHAEDTDVTDSVIARAACAVLVGKVPFSRAHAAERRPAARSAYA